MQASTNLLNDITDNDRKPFNYNSLNSNKNSLVASMSFTVGAWASTAVNRNLKHQKNSSNLAKNNSGEKFCHFRSSEFFHFTEIFRFCSHRVSSRNEFWISRQRLFSKINSSIIFFFRIGTGEIPASHGLYKSFGMHTHGRAWLPSEASWSWLSRRVKLSLAGWSSLLCWPPR